MCVFFHRIQQIQLLGKDLKSEDHNRLWEQLEAEIHLHRHKTVIRACQAQRGFGCDALSPPGHVRIIKQQIVFLFFFVYGKFFFSRFCLISNKMLNEISVNKYYAIYSSSQNCGKLLGEKYNFKILCFVIVVLTLIIQNYTSLERKLN